MSWFLPKVRTVFCCVVGMFLVACASTQQNSKTLQIPLRSKVYVSVFVDKTEQGEIGLALTDAIRQQIYRQNPRQLAMFFDEDSVVIDGTVLKLQETSLSSRETEVEIFFHARLLLKSGEEVANLRQFSVKNTYAIDRDMNQTDLNRMRALDSSIRTAADQIIIRIDQIGRTTQPEEPKPDELRRERI